jgi:hypothetical protein
LILTDEQLDQVIEFAMAQFHPKQSITCRRLVWFIHSQSTMNWLNTVRRALQCDQTI